MSIDMCKFCSNYYDQDYDVEHEGQCEADLMDELEVDGLSGEEEYLAKLELIKERYI